MGGAGGLEATDPRVVKARDLLLSYIQPDGGIYDPEEGLTNYTTSLALMVLARLPDVDPKIITKPLRTSLLACRILSGGINDGGIGYGSKGPGNEDLSNTSHAIEALKMSGMPADHPAMQRALAFVSRCQNLSSTNPLHWAGKDGPVQGGQSMVHTKARLVAVGVMKNRPQPQWKKLKRTGVMRSYGSMTYAMIKSFIYLDVKRMTHAYRQR